MRTALLLSSLGVALIASPVVAQTRAQSVKPKLTKLLVLDSLSFDAPELSPDGRWVIFGGGPLNARPRSIWIAKAGTNQVRQLTKGDYKDEYPIWSPKGDRIVFKSSRVDGGLMIMGINPSTGEVTEPPRRLTLEQSTQFYAVSPDGRWVAYAALGTPSAHGPLRVVPSAGGAARTVDSLPPGRRNALMMPKFSADGRAVEYLVTELQEGAPPDETLKSVPVSGGTPRVLYHKTVPGRVFDHRDGLVVEGVRGTDSVAVINLNGDTLALPVMTHLAGVRTRLGSRPGSLVATTIVGVNEVHVISTDGSAPRVAGMPSAEAYTGGFLTGDRVIVTDHANGQSIINIVSLNGGAARRITLPDSLNVDAITIDGKLIYWHRGGTRGAFDVATGKSRIFSHTNFAGGIGDFTSLLTSTDEFVYRESNAGVLELRAWSPTTGNSRLVRALPGMEGTRADFVMHKDLAAYSAMSGDSASIFVAATPSSQPQRVVTVRSNHTDAISISRDGRHVVFGVQTIVKSDTGHAIGFVDLNADGTLAGPVRMVPSPNVTGVTWLPNNEEIVYSVTESTGSTVMMRMAAREGARPRVISDGEREHFYEFVASPDGRWIAYPTQRAGVATVWRVDFRLASKSAP
jgi:Tol biopolymer transport system component